MRVFDPEHLDDLTRCVMMAAGWPEEDAAELARHLVLANLSGHDSHGVGVLPLYLNAVQDGLLLPANMPVDRIAAPPFLVIDGQVALGQPTASRALARACDMAKAHGVAVLNLIDAHHVGRIGDYAEQAAARGLISLFWVNVAGRTPIVAPHGAREARWGTNPHAVGIPVANGEHIILDFATSRMAHGKVRVALLKGEQTAPGYLIDRDGEPTTDPAVAFPPLPMGALLPFGEHKGAGLSLIVEILSAGLSGGALIKDKPALSWIINSLFAIVIDPARVGEDDAAREERIESIVAFLRSAQPFDPEQPVRAPGDVERQIRLKRRAEGIPIDAETWRQIVAGAAAFGVSAD